MCIHLIISFVTDDLAQFIVFVLPREVKVYTLFGNDRVREATIKIVIFSVGHKNSV